MSDQVNKAHQATPAATLEQQIMDPNFPKNEREWWAAARIERQAAALRRLLGDFGHTLPNGTKDMIRAVLEEECTSS